MNHRSQAVTRILKQRAQSLMDQLDGRNTAMVAHAIARLHIKAQAFPGMNCIVLIYDPLPPPIQNSFLLHQGGGVQGDGIFFSC